MYDIMSKHWDFLEGLQKSTYLDKLIKHKNNSKPISPIYKINRQHKEFFEYILSNSFSEGIKEEYLDTMGRFSSEEESQETICLDENMEHMGNKERYWRTWHDFCT